MQTNGEGEVQKQVTLQMSFMDNPNDEKREY